MLKNRFLLVLLWYICHLNGWSQETGHGSTATQCSSIREIIYSAHVAQFENLLNEEIKGSQGYQVQGCWRFETVQYGSLLQWPGATKSYIDHSVEQTDTSKKMIRQYVAEYSGLQSVTEARYRFEMLNRQIGDCRLPLSDTNIVVLKPIPLDKIKGELPVAALDAKLYPVTVKNADAVHSGQEVVIMTAYEKNGRLYSAYMIVEYRLKQD